ncbi:hypothetical protein [Acidovorax sp.]|nr:hypothetical protein [Acidovorax sp.]
MKKFIVLGIVATSLSALTACDVKKTQEGNVTLPKYEVEKNRRAT